MKGTDVKCIVSPDIQITDISWERLLLHITIEADPAKDLSFSIAKIVFPKESNDEDDDHGRVVELDGTLLQEMPLTPVSKDGGVCRFCINMSIADG